LLYPLASASSSEHPSVKLALGGFYKAVDFIVECSRHPPRPRTGWTPGRCSSNH